jgi:hypothetical protein
MEQLQGDAPVDDVADIAVPEAAQSSPRPQMTIETHSDGSTNPITDANGPNSSAKRKMSLLKQNSSFVSPTGAHIDKPKQGRRLSFSDETGESLVETNFSDKLHYSAGHTNFSMQQQSPNYSAPSKNGCCTIS